MRRCATAHCNFCSTRSQTENRGQAGEGVPAKHWIEKECFYEGQNKDRRGRKMVEALAYSMSSLSSLELSVRLSFDGQSATHVSCPVIHFNSANLLVTNF